MEMKAKTYMRQQDVKEVKHQIHQGQIDTLRGVTSRFLFVHLNFLPLPNLVRLVKVILPYFLPFAKLRQCPAGKSTIGMWNSFYININ